MSVETSVRHCAYVECDNPLVKKPNESHAAFADRKFCCSACSAAARRTHPEKPRSRGLNATPNASPPPFQPRYEAGVWRPNAPGWPARPSAIPGGSR